MVTHNFKMHALDVHYGDDLGLSNGNLHQQFVCLLPLRNIAIVVWCVISKLLHFDWWFFRNVQTEQNALRLAQEMFWNKGDLNEPLMLNVLLDQVVPLSKVLKPVDIHANLYWRFTLPIKSIAPEKYTK